jgi:hypothetical protein
LTASTHPAAPHHHPVFITAPGETDYLMVAMTVILLVSVLAIGNLFLRLHTLPERMAHKGQKMQFEIVAVLGLLALFTHIHAFWVAGLLLALIDLPDFGTPLHRMAGSLEKMAGIDPDDSAAEAPRRGHGHDNPHGHDPHGHEPKATVQPIAEQGQREHAAEPAAAVKAPAGKKELTHA